ncbi:hypothetical protein, partial [Neisseria subflava]|uniref:hypothetical protein n=2 Tax=Neisseria subflava TaxID=28449 RepID=UPI00280ABAF2
MSVGNTGIDRHSKLEADIKNQGNIIPKNKRQQYKLKRGLNSKGRLKEHFRRPLFCIFLYVWIDSVGSLI